MALLTPAQLAAELGLDDPAGANATRKVLDWRIRYGWPAVVVGRTVRFTDEHVDLIVRQHSKAGAPRPSKAAPTTAAPLPGQTSRSARS